MWLVLTGVAALVTTALWGARVWASKRGGAGTGQRSGAAADKYKLGFLSLIYWGATLMWLVDHVLSYLEEGGPFLEINAEGMALGLSVLVLGLAIWLARLLVFRLQGSPGAAGKK